MGQVIRPGAGTAGARAQDAPVRRQLTRALSFMLVPLALLTIANLSALQRTLQTFDHALEHGQAAVPFSRLRAALAALELPAYDVLVADRPDARGRLGALLDDVDPLFDVVRRTPGLDADEDALVATAASEWATAEAIAAAAVALPVDRPSAKDAPWR